ncbi:MAG TPA: dihydropteroate synthase [Mycobacteriales bacterium]|nr:dihydropteroate synthase [Mycobacteriales bacterium]HWA67522.1 dihydropteroate synthase [Mycobacteriales bacterium]
MGGLPDLGRTAVMGVVNVTPDSFSDSGLHFDVDAAIAHGLALAADGADLVDVGGESTRPGAARIECAEELRRVLPVVSALSEAGLFVSIDTMRAEVAAAAMRAGARLVNDVSGGLADPALPRLMADVGMPYVVMHWRGHSADMYAHATYDDVVREVCGELRTRVDAVMAAGVAPDAIVIDPGIGFAKKAEHNWQLLAHLDALVGLGFPVLVGASRKSFLGTLLATDAGPRDAVARDDATTAVTTLAAAAGVWGVRVHRARPSADAVRVVAETARHGWESGR